MKNVSIRVTNVFLLLFLLAYLGISVLLVLFIRGMELSYAVESFLSLMPLLLPVVIFMLVKKIAPHKIDFVKLPKPFDMVLSYIFAYTLFPAIYLLNIITMTFSENYVNDVMGELFDTGFLVMLLLIAVFPAVIEEFIFRGIFFTSYRKRNVLGAVLMSGLVFGLIHLNVNQCAYAMMMGVAFALLVEASGSIVNSMVAHFAINANSVFMLQIVKQTMSYEEYILQSASEEQITEAPLFIYVVLLAFAIGGMALAVCILRTIAKRNGRTEHMQQVFADGLTVRAEGTDRFFDICSVAVIFIAAAYMIWLLMAV